MKRRKKERKKDGKKQSYCESERDKDMSILDSKRCNTKKQRRTRSTQKRNKD